jgi:hypothetical protein
MEFAVIWIAVRRIIRIQVMIMSAKSGLPYSISDLEVLKLWNKALEFVNIT